MAEEKNPDLFFLRIFPKCPFYKPVPVLIILVLIALGTAGVYYLNYWVAVVYLIYSFLFYFLIMPLTMCKYCYFKVKETTTDNETGKTTEKLLSVDGWAKSHLRLHVGQKGWSFALAIVWLSPFVLVGLSFLTSFSIFAVLSLIGFTIVVVGNFYYMLRVKCPSCPIQEECHSSF